MNQTKIGKFIAECRKQKKLTQMQLAEKLNITDKAISKWERGLSLPDSSIMLELCGILGITVNDLLSGEVITMDNYNKELEKNLVEMIRQKEQADKRLLETEITMGIVCIIPIIAAVLLNLFLITEGKSSTVLALVSVIPLLFATPFMLKIEQNAGYYECAKCGHKYIPSFASVFFSMHMGRTRKMRCPKCNEKSWQKKVISRE